MVKNDCFYHLFTDIECPLSRFSSVSDNFPKGQLCGVRESFYSKDTLKTKQFFSIICYLFCDYGYDFFSYFCNFFNGID